MAGGAGADTSVASPVAAAADTTTTDAEGADPYRTSHLV